MITYVAGRTFVCDTRLPSGDEVTWLHLENPTDDVVHEVLGGVFDCHPLVVEDILHFGQRPKLEHYVLQACPQVFICFYAVNQDLSTTEFCMVVAERFVITVTREAVPFLTTLYQDVLEQPEVMASTGSLVYRILDVCVDDYFGAVDALQDKLDSMEQRVFDHPEEKIASAIFRMKRTLHRVRRLVSDGRNVVGMLAHEGTFFTDASHVVYFVDVYDHASRVVDAIDGIRDTLSGLLDLQTSQRANRMNEVMMTLTIISTIFLPASFIVGLYGVNLKGVPEYRWSFGYWWAWGLILAVTGVMLYYFKRKRWW